MLRLAGLPAATGKGRSLMWTVIVAAIGLWLIAAGFVLLVVKAGDEE